jgi:homoaconitase/3-isopropylmalate dehydratase large subunit
LEWLFLFEQRRFDEEGKDEIIAHYGFSSVADGCRRCLARMSSGGLGWSWMGFQLWL